MSGVHPVSDDYYALLDLPETATEDQIATAIREQRRVWVRRQSSPDPDRRTLAEQRVRELDGAERVLLDAASRADYDRGRKRQGTTGVREGPTPTPAPARPPPEPSDRSDAPHPTGPREPTGVDGWLSRARAAYERGDLEEAVRAYTRAVRLAPDHADARRGLGDAYLAQERYRQAVTEYEQVLAALPDDRSARVGLAECYLHTERVQEGVATLKQVAEEEPNDPVARRGYAYALYQEAWDGLAEVPDGKLAMSRRQVWLLRRNVRRLRSLGDDPEVNGWRAQLASLLQDATRRRKMPSHRKRYYLGGLVVSLFLALAGPVEAYQVIGAVFFLFIGWMYVQRHRPQMWQVRRKQLRKQTLQRGI